MAGNLFFLFGVGYEFMTIVEKVSVLGFLGIVGTVYLSEFGVLAGAAVKKLWGKDWRKVMFCKSAMVIHFLAVVGVLCVCYGYFIEPYWVEVNTVRIETDKLSEENFRVVQISDMHCDVKMRNEERIVELINAMEPDVIVYTGDSLNDASALKLFKKTMKGLEARQAKLAVRGNFDVWHRVSLDVFGGTGFEVLDKKTVEISKGAESIGISGLSCGDPEGFRNLLEKNREGRYNVFAYHYPDLIEEMEGLNVDLYLCGHTHGGQIALPFYGALITLSKHGKKYEAGSYRVGETDVYVNRGIGMEAGSAPRVRFFARPEVTVFEIGPKR